MDRVLQILAVFGLLMLLIWRSIRGREERFRRFSYLARVRPPLAAEITERLVYGITKRSEGYERGGEWRSSSDEVHGRGGEAYGMPLDADAFLWDEDSRMLLFYWLDGKLTINRRVVGGRNRELQELAVPMDCAGMAWDPQERKIYLEEDGDWFVYGEEE
jgi:hypothetical protein